MQTDIDSTATPMSTPLNRLDDLVREERYAWHQVVDAISRWLYLKPCDELPASVRTRVEGSALRAIRSPQAAWTAESLRRAHLAAERAMAEEMGPVFRSQAPRAIQAQTGIFIQAVLSALIGVLEVEQPFNGAGDALKVYEAADAAVKEVR